MNTNDYANGLAFDQKLMTEIRNRFCNVEEDEFGKRIFFENSGGSLRLKACIDAVASVDSQPDCPGRHQKEAYIQDDIVKKGKQDLNTIFNTDKGSYVSCLSASQVMFKIVQAIAENVPGDNMVVSVLEHPSAFDSVAYYAEKTGKALRVLQSNPKTGGIDVEEVLKNVDEKTTLLSCMYASNVTGAIQDIEKMVQEARKIKPDLFIIVDAVQHIPHGLVDLSKLDIDAMNIAPYKFFGCRGSGIGWLSKRAAVLPHDRIACYDEDQWELGSVAPHQYAGFSAIVDYVCWIGEQFVKSTDRRTLYEEGMNRIKLHERALLHRALEGTNTLKGLRHIKGIHVAADNPDLTERDLILAVHFDNMDSTAAAKAYIDRGVYVFERKSPHHYSKRIVESFGLEGVVRVSPLHCNTIEEVDEFLKASQEIAQM